MAVAELVSMEEAKEEVEVEEGMMGKGSPKSMVT